MFNLSLPNNRNDLLKEALVWLSDSTGQLTITPETINMRWQRRHGGDLAGIPKRAGGAIA
jgi:hypothetical protein